MVGCFLLEKLVMRVVLFDSRWVVRSSLVVMSCWMNDWRNNMV